MNRHGCTGDVAERKKSMKHYIERKVVDLFSRFNIRISRINSSCPPEVFFETDGEFTSLYLLAQEKTRMVSSDNLLRRQRHHTLVQLLRQGIRRGTQGNVAECGCWRGLSSYQIAAILKKNGFSEKFYIFDSFEGLSAFGDEDLTGAGLPDEETRRKEFSCNEEIVKGNLGEFSFIELKKGWIPDRFTEVSDKQFSFVHIDVDLYQPIRDALLFFYPRVVPGGIIVLDDYGCLAFPGAKQAVDEFMAGKNDFFLHLPSGSAFIVKADKSAVPAGSRP